MAEIRPGTQPDMETLNELYNHYVRTSACTFDIDEISMDARLAWFEEFGGRYKLLVAAEEGRAVGYAVSKYFRPKQAYETSVETSVYVAHDRHGRGIGGELYAGLFEALDGEDVHRAYAGITVPNPASFVLHERFGFRQVAYFTEQGRKFDKYWDVAWLEKEL
ncbi:MAG: GNAT family N-acetyltransferase [Actinomycetota bacterium]